MILKIYPQGIVTRREKLSVRFCSGNAPSRKCGDIKSFSRHSRKRLRCLLAEYSSNDMHSITLTLPGSAPSMSELDYTNFWHDFSSHYSRDIKAAWLWRVEMQVKRNLPHWHICLWGDLTIAHCFASRWRDCCYRWFSFDDRSYRNFARYGVNILPCVNGSNTLSYLVDHTSKRKESQLGWRGRQWGVVHRKLLVSDLKAQVDINDSELVLICRYLRRLKRSLSRCGIYSSISPRVNRDTFFSSFYGRDKERLEKVLQVIKKNKIF